MHPLTSISPIDGRYQHELTDLRAYFSEAALLRYRVLVEVEYLLALSTLPHVRARLKLFSAEEKTALRRIYNNFTHEDALHIKHIEVSTNHDVKAIEYFLQEKLTELSLPSAIPFLHFALTSEDVNNLAYSMMLKGALSRVYLPALDTLITSITYLARIHAGLPMLALTHGQSATPTTLGKELAVFVSRLNVERHICSHHSLKGKLNGATGTWAAHAIAYPTVDWPAFSGAFIKSLGLAPNLLTTQIESHDSLVELFHIAGRINTILIGVCRDMWSYISRGVIAQKPNDGEVGSSTMPHKVNPIQFENAEGNLGIANAYFEHFAAKLPISRMQRDLSDSTVLRNQGMPFAHSILAFKNILKGLDRIAPNKLKMKQELDEHPEVMAEAIQTVLRKHGHADAYEQLKYATRGKEITIVSLREFIIALNIPQEDKERLLALTPATYIGLAADVTKKNLA